jgi:hypothetical protein
MSNSTYSAVVARQKIDIDAVVDSRHYYSHFYKKKANDHLVSGKDLYLLTQQLKKLLTCCVLYETGFTNQEMIDITNT